MSKNRNDSRKLILAATLLGGFIGMTVAYLTPKMGDRFRQKTDKFLDVGVGGKLTSLFGMLRQRTMGSLKQGGRILDDTVKLLSKAYDAGKEAYEKEGSSQDTAE